MGISADRQLVPELMDAPDLDAAAHGEALAGLERLNRLSGAAKGIAEVVEGLGLVRKVDRLTMLDVACGGGDVPVEVALFLLSKGNGVEMTLTDRSATALARAQVRAQRAGVPTRVELGSAPAGLPKGEWDVVTNSLFLHHLERSEVVETLRAMAERARGAVVVSDLRRSWVGWLVAWVMCRVVTRSRIVHFDGPVSVKAAWTCAEMREMAAEAGMTGARVEAVWPWRMLLVWERR